MDGLARLQWQCRRGMLELDLLLEGYLETRYPVAGEAEKAGFAELLKLEDGELLALMLSNWSVKDSE
ncbi:MAG: succinate dehydrogenase assembly factor 2 [Methylovulum sp.]|nr:succinate dehydrogenase assembly factor 2 [Methylovulum sp.]